MTSADSALAAWPKWCGQKVDSTKQQCKGELILHEIENVKVVISKYLQYLEEQDEQNLFALAASESSHQSHHNTKFAIIKKKL
eukprot:4627837-Ditylum_brightwellii.AAC.1